MAELVETYLDLPRPHQALPEFITQRGKKTIGSEREIRLIETCGLSSIIGWGAQIMPV